VSERNRIRDTYSVNIADYTYLITVGEDAQRRIFKAERDIMSVMNIKPSSVAKSKSRLPTSKSGNLDFSFLSKSDSREETKERKKSQHVKRSKV
jgi:hypothetical protein